MHRVYNEFIRSGERLHSSQKPSSTSKHIIRMDMWVPTGKCLKGYMEVVEWERRERNEEGERVVDFAMSFDLAICNTFFQKNER